MYAVQYTQNVCSTLKLRKKDEKKRVLDQMIIWSKILKWAIIRYTYKKTRVFSIKKTKLLCCTDPRAVVLHLNFRAGSTFPVPVYTVPHEHWLN